MTVIEVLRAFVSLPSLLLICQLPWLRSKLTLHSTCLFVWCLSISHFLSLSLFCSLFGECGAIALVSCRDRNLKGSGINKRKASQTKLQWGFGRHASSGATCAHKELSVRVAVLRIPRMYSPSHSQSIQSHTQQSYTQITEACHG